MTKFKKIAAAFCAAAMAVCSMAAMTVSAAEPQLPSTLPESLRSRYTGNVQLWEKRFYKPENGQIFVRQVRNYEMIVQYRKSSNDYKMLDYRKNGAGDVNMDGKIDKTDVKLIQQIAALRLANLNPLTHGYTLEQCWRAAVTQPEGYQVENADATVVLAYYNNKSKGKLKNVTLEEYICTERNALIRYEVDAFTREWGTLKNYKQYEKDLLNTTTRKNAISHIYNVATPNMDTVCHEANKTNFYINVNCKNIFLN